MDKLPEDIANILDGLAAWAAGYDTGLKWNEVAKLKADLMYNRAYWIGIPLELIQQECEDLGMKPEDVTTITDLVGKAQAGKRLVPDRSYRDHRFNHGDRDPHGPATQPRTTRDW